MTGLWFVYDANKGDYKTFSNDISAAAFFEELVTKYSDVNVPVVSALDATVYFGRVTKSAHFVDSVEVVTE